LKAFTDGADTTLLGRQFHRLTTLNEKNGMEWSDGGGRPNWIWSWYRRDNMCDGPLEKVDTAKGSTGIEAVTVVRG